MPLDHSNPKEKSSYRIIQQLEEASKRHEIAANTDPLTGIYNRAFFETETKRLSHYRHHTHLFIIDVDKFKSINDSYGHPQGDEVLKDTARILTTSFREEDAVCRIGGDEFAVLMTDDNTEKYTEIADQKIKQILGELIDNNEKRQQQNLPIFSFSIGHAYYDPQKNHDIYEAIKNADDDLYRQKKLKDNR